MALDVELSGATGESRRGVNAVERLTLPPDGMEAIETGEYGAAQKAIGSSSPRSRLLQSAVALASAGIVRLDVVLRVASCRDSNASAEIPQRRETRA
jgi:hypothetical protein